MHLPDGFLSEPVWIGLDAAAIPALGYAVRRAQAGFDESRIPLLGVMGAFVFAAQMINFPVGAGTSGHLVGGALLAFTLGPAAASVVMAAILAIQAFVFQDGGLLALGSNILNMAIFGVLAGYLPFHIWGQSRFRKLAIFAGGTLSVLVSALMALSELLISGVRMAGPVLAVSLGLFLISAVLEGAITLAVMQGLEAIQPRFVRKPAHAGGWAVSAAGIAAVLLAGAGALVASTDPDGIEKLAEITGIASRAQTLLSGPFAGYRAVFLQSPWLGTAAAGLAGVAIIYAACRGLGRLVARNRSC